MVTAKSPKTVEVNLLPGEDLETRPGGKFLKWALSWGKRIVIITEGIVILAFLSRFWLDTTVADLTEKITSKKGAVEASAKFEKTFRQTTERIEKAGRIEQETSLLAVYDKARTLIPNGITISQMAVTTKGLTLTGTGTETSLAVLVAAFRKSPSFDDLTIDKITKVSPSETIDFSMKASYSK
ncbi:hypothetical protein HY440_01005 [Candidatus Microgenomates bacterium]|nr:hypothetical protein [Candidatus Microgenomates bacterium]